MDSNRAIMTDGWVQGPRQPDRANFCCLSPEELEARIAKIRREILPRVLARLKLANGVGWEFEATADNRRRLEDLTELERQCCRGLNFEIREDADGTRLRWEILGIDPNTEFFPDRRSSTTPGSSLSAASSSRAESGGSRNDVGRGARRSLRSPLGLNCDC